MRVVVVILALLAAAKVWTQDRMYREAAGEALLAAYKVHAQAACRARPQTDKRGMPLTAGNVDWGKAGTAEVLIGNPRISVPIWQFDHPQWDQRYKHPVVRLTVGDSLSRLACDYDVMAGSAEILVL